MMNLKSDSIMKLKSCKISEISSKVNPFLVNGEMIFSAFTTDNKKVIFTNKRIIMQEIVDISSGRIDFTSLPYSKVAAFSMESSDIVNIDSEIEVYFSGIGKFKFQIQGGGEAKNLNKIVSGGVLL